MTVMELSNVLGNLGEFLGSIAVLATLIYVAIQVRHSRLLLEENRRISLSQVFDSRTDRRVQMSLALLASDSCDDVYDLFDNPEHLNEKAPEARNRIRAYMAASATHTDNMLYQLDLGLLEHESGAIGFAKRMHPLWEELGVSTPRTKRAFEEFQDQDVRWRLDNPPV